MLHINEFVEHEKAESFIFIGILIDGGGNSEAGENVSRTKFSAWASLAGLGALRIEVSLGTGSLLGGEYILICDV